jgi:hypothetical protein
MKTEEDSSAEVTADRSFYAADGTVTRAVERGRMKGVDSRPIVMISRVDPTGVPERPKPYGLDYLGQPYPLLFASATGTFANDLEAERERDYPMSMKERRQVRAYVMAAVATLAMWVGGSREADAQYRGFSPMAAPTFRAPMPMYRSMPQSTPYMLAPGYRQPFGDPALRAGRFIAGQELIQRGRPWVGRAVRGGPWGLLLWPEVAR